MLSPNVSTTSDMLMTQGSGSRKSSVNHGATEYSSIFTKPSFSTFGTPVPYTFAYRQTTTEGFTPRPSLLTFRAPPYINVEGWDYTAEFYDDEILAGDQLADQFDELLLQPVDLSKRTTRRLQQSFVENFLRWTPILDQKTCVAAVEQAATDDYLRQDATTCLTFMLLALGAISVDRSDRSEERRVGKECPV